MTNNNTNVFSEENKMDPYDLVLDDPAAILYADDGCYDDDPNVYGGTYSEE